DAIVLGTLRRDHDDRLLTSVAQAWAHGLTVNWSPLLAGGRRVPLPPYAFQHRRFWLPAPAPAADAPGLGLTALDHPLLGAVTALPEQSGLVLTGRLSTTDQPWLTGHVIAGTTILPGTAFVELALRAAAEAGGEIVEDLTLHRPLVLPATGSVAVQVAVAAPDAAGRRTFTIHSRDGETWTQHATGTVAPGAADALALGTWPQDGAVDLDGFYAGLAARGYGYGPSFQGLKAVSRTPGALWAEIELPGGDFGIHPALLDAALHPLLLDVAGGELRVPFAWSRIRLHAIGASQLRVRLTPGPDGAVALVAYDGGGQPVLSVDGLRFQTVTRDEVA